MTGSVHCCDLVVCFLLATTGCTRRTVPSPGGLRTRPTPRGWRVGTKATKSRAGPSPAPVCVCQVLLIIPWPLQVEHVRNIFIDPKYWLVLSRLSAALLSLPWNPSAHPSLQAVVPFFLTQCLGFAVTVLCLGTNAVTRAHSQQVTVGHQPDRFFGILTKMLLRATVLKRGWGAGGRVSQPTGRWQTGSSGPRGV